MSLIFDGESANESSVNNLPKATSQKIDKLVKIADALRSGKETYFSITCLTSLKSLCKEADTAARFVTYLAEKIQNKANLGEKPQHTAPEDWERYKALINEATPLLQAHVESPTPDSLAALRAMLPKLGQVQELSGKEYWGRAVVTVYSKDVLIVENAVQCILSPWVAPKLAYETARYYCELYNPSYGTGLIPESAPILEDVIAFWSGR